MPSPPRLADLNALARRGWAGRAAALDALEVHGARLGADTDGLRAACEADAAAAAARLRARWAAGRGTPQGRRHAATRLLARGGDDALELFVDTLLDAGGPLEETLLRDPEHVFYQPTPGRVVLALAAELRPDDVLVDLGAGLGRVVCLAALWAGVRAVGIEREPAYVAHARRSAAALSLDGVDVVEGDLLTAPFDGDVVFFYTPVRGARLRQLAARLTHHAGPALRTYAWGPCVDELLALPGWSADVGPEGLAALHPPTTAGRGP